MQTLRDGYNYGLFVPPSKGRAGKFLIEDRRIKDYNITHGSLLEVGFFPDVLLGFADLVSYLRILLSSLAL